MNKTPIQQAIHRLNDLADAYAANKRIVRANDLYNAALICESLLKTEKQQIIDAYNQCHRNSIQSDPAICFKTGEQYFNETFEK